MGASDQDEAGSRQWITWTPSTRTFGRGGQHATDNNILRIVGVRLYDDGGSAAAAGGALPDDSIAPSKIQADSAAQRKAWRERTASAHIGAGTALPDNAVSNVGDVWIFPQDVANGLSWRDISDVATEITSANAGDVALFLPRSNWVRVGNILSNAVALATAAKTAADANTATRWPGVAVPIPPFIAKHHLGEYTFNVYFRQKDSGSHPAGTRMRVDIGGSQGAFVAVSGDDFSGPASITVNAANMRNLITNNAADGYILGKLQLSPADSAAWFEEVPIVIPLIDPVVEAPSVVQDNQEAAVNWTDAIEHTLATVRITPRSATTKVRLDAGFDVQADRGATGNGTFDLRTELRLYRGNVRLPASRMVGNNHAPANDDWWNDATRFYVDSPASVAEQIYTLRAISVGNNDRQRTGQNRILIATEVL